MEEADLAAKLAAESIDVTLPGRGQHCQISQNLTVDLDGRFFQASDETAVGQTCGVSEHAKDED